MERTPREETAQDQVDLNASVYDAADVALLTKCSVNHIYACDAKRRAAIAGNLPPAEQKKGKTPDDYFPIDSIRLGRKLVWPGEPLRRLLGLVNRSAA